MSFVLDGAPLAAHVLPAVDRLKFAEKLVVARGQSWTSMFVKAGFRVFCNIKPELGLSSSLRLGVENSSADHVLVMLGDMPYVTLRHLQRLAQTYADHGPQPVATSGQSGIPTPPAFLPRKLLVSLSLTGDCGARAMIEGARLVEAPNTEIRDIDTRADFVGL